MVMTSLSMLMTPTTIGVMIASALYGLIVGAIPGFSAAMAVALMVPVTYFLDPVPALAGVVTLCAMSIFSGDIPGALLRIPGTPASAAYVDEAYQMTRKGQAGLALGTGLVCSSIGGIFGSIALMLAAPMLGNLALQFSSVEYFWLACLGLTAAIGVSQGSFAKGLVSLGVGLTIAMVGLDPVSGQPRFTFGQSALSGGLGFIPVLIGLFAMSEIFRFARGSGAEAHQQVGKMTGLFKGIGREIKRLFWQILQGCGLGTLIGAIPGAGADIASYITYAATRKQSAHPEKFGTGIVDGLAASSASNNASIGGALVPATVFGIPGDSLTAVIIGVLYMKGLNPGPTVFLMQGDLLNAIFMAFLLANILILPFGYLAIRLFRHILSIPRAVLMPLIVAACIIGAFAVENTLFAVITMLGAGLLGLYMEDNGFPVAPAILGVVLAPVLEENFLNTLVRSNGDLMIFFSRPVAIGLAVATFAILVLPLFKSLRRQRTRTDMP